MLCGVHVHRGELQQVGCRFYSSPYLQRTISSEDASATARWCAILVHRPRQVGISRTGAYLPTKSSRLISKRLVLFHLPGPIRRLTVGTRGGVTSFLFFVFAARLQQGIAKAKSQKPKAKSQKPRSRPVRYWVQCAYRDFTHHARCHAAAGIFNKCHHSFPAYCRVYKAPFSFWAN